MRPILAVLLVVSLSSPVFGQAAHFDGVDQRLERLGSSSWVAPFTIQVCAKLDTGASGSSYALFSSADPGSSVAYFVLLLESSGSVDMVCRTSAGGNKLAPTANTVTEAQWFCALGTAKSGAEAERRTYLNGDIANSGLSAGDCAPVNNSLCVGELCDATPGFNFPGSIMSITFWNSRLTDKQIIALGRDRFDPRLVRSADIISHWTLENRDYRDQVGPRDLTAINAPNNDDGTDGDKTPLLTLAF